jgi:hypothetical protein
VVRKQQCLVVPNTVQDVDDFDEVRSNPIEGQIVCVDTPADAVVFKAGERADGGAAVRQGSDSDPTVPRQNLRRGRDCRM